MNSFFCDESKFERNVLNLIKNNNWEQLKKILIGNENMLFDPNTINLKQIFIQLGRKDIDGVTKHSILEQILRCFDVFEGRIISNRVIVEAVRNNLEVIDETILKYGFLDCKVDGLDYSYWLYESSNTNILDKYLNYFNEEVPWLIYKFCGFGNYENEFILYLKSKISKKVNVESNPELIQIILLTEYGISAVIDKEDILKLEINNQQLESFLLSEENYIFKINLHVNRDLKDDENIFEEFNDILAIRVITRRFEYNYKIPPFFETIYGINYLQRYRFDNNVSIFEYDYTSLSCNIFGQEEFEAMVKSRLCINSDQKLSKIDLVKLEKLHLIFDDDINLYDLEKTMKEINKLKNLKILEIEFIGYENTPALDVKCLKGLSALKVIKVFSLENAKVINIQCFDDKRVDVKLHANDSCELLEIIFDNFIETKATFVKQN